MDLEKSVDDLMIDKMQELIRSQVEGFGKAGSKHQLACPHYRFKDMFD